MSIEDYNTDAIDIAYDYLETYNSSSGKGGNEINETANKCYVLDEIDDFTIESIAPGEVCTIETAQSYGIFGKDQYFNNLLQERNDVNTYNSDSDANLTYSLCSVADDKAVMNCALSTRNPWKSLDETGQYCMLPIEIPLPQNMKYNEETVLIEKPQDIPLALSKKELCSNRWYDWFSIPDYHLGNMYSSNENNKCMKPCQIGAIPVENNKCTNREAFKRGFYKKDFYYLPLSLVLLLGSTKETLLKKHKQEIANLRSKFDSSISIDYEIYNTIMTDEKTQNDIYETIRTDLNHHITNFLTKPFDDTHIIVPSKAIQNLSTVQSIMTKDNILEAYNIAAKYFILSVNPDKEEEFERWKKDLSDINGYETTDDKFYKQLLILKKACNVLFDNKSAYSRDNVLYSINIDLDEGEAVKQPIVFEITEKDSILAMSKNSAEVPVDKMDIKDQSVKKREEELAGIKSTNGDKEEGGVEITQVEEVEEVDTTLALDRKGSSKSNTTSTLAQIIAIFVIVLFVMLVIAILAILVNFFWYYVAEFMNIVIISFAYLLYGVRDLFRMKWTPSALNIEIAELQKSFVNKKIMTDMSRFKA